MLRFAADENLNHAIVRGLMRRFPDLDIIRVQDVALSGADDPTVLAWAAREERLLLTHDVTTMTAYVNERVQAGLPMPGLIEVRRVTPLAQVIEDIILLATCSLAREWEGQIIYLPL